MPVHSFYGGAHLFAASTFAKLGSLARAAMAEYAPDAEALGAALGISPELAGTVHTRVREKLEREPLEDYHIDFEDGYGFRPDAEEDAAAEAAAAETARAMEAGTLPESFGIRIKPFSPELRKRAMATLERFLRGVGTLPSNFCVTLPKVTDAEQVRALALAPDPYPEARIEIMVETPGALFILPQLVQAAGGRLVGANFGPYDYTASLGLTASNQDILHPACDFARNMMLAALAGTGVVLSDGPTNLMPIGPHRGADLTRAQVEANRTAVHRAWKLHYTHVRHALDSGFYRGWDLHPAQLAARYAAVYAFFLEGLTAASARLRNFIEKAAQATRVGQVFDDAATGQGLLNYFLRAMECGAVPPEETIRLAGLTLAELSSASFTSIVEGRRG